MKLVLLAFIVVVRADVFTPPRVTLRWSPPISKESRCPINYFILNLDKQWINFKKAFGRDFASNRIDRSRKSIFKQNLRTINMHNHRHSRGLESFTMAVNQFADLTSEEFKSIMTSNTKPGSGSQLGSPFLAPLNVADLPSEVDWRKEGYVTPVKNQGTCGSCWAFSSTGAIEGHHFRKTGKLVSLSEQNLVDCSKDFGSHGCNGGFMDQAFQYVKNNSGIATEDSYPYFGLKTVCQFKIENVGATVSGYVTIEAGNEEQLQQALATVGPVSTAINARLDSFRFYSSGVYDVVSCNQDLDHGVLAVGYGTEKRKDYWLVKNSWGESWGDKGYVKMSRNKFNQCGIASAASYPLV